MTILTLSKKELEKKIGKIDDKLRNKIDMFGTPIDGETNDELQIEVFPNRPDLLSLQGFARSLSAFLGKKVDNKYVVEKSGEILKIEKSLPKQWPYALSCIVKGMKFNEEKIREVIEIQEKLGMSLLRKRKKGGIGIYPLEKIKFPVKFVGMNPDEIKFRPLEFPKVITGRQILNKHPTGREYAHICQDWEKFPVFIDANGTIMSMPPIINSHEVGKIDNTTKDLFVEATGNNFNVLQDAFNMIVTALSDMGGKIYSIECQQDGKKLDVPNLEAKKMEFSVDYINKNLGLELGEKEIVGLLRKMGIEVDGIAGKSSSDDLCHVALIPAYRADIIHEIDLVEEVAIAYGYDNFKPEIPEISTIGSEDSLAIMKRKISEVLIGLGLIEISTYHLSTKERQFKKIGMKEFKDKIIEVMDSKTENNILRTSLFANSIQVLSENSDASYPQKIFEIGKVFYDEKASLISKNNEKMSETGIGESERLCISLCYEKANFTDLKQMLDYMMRMFDLKYEIREIDREGFIEGRVGEVVVNDTSIGIIGEVHPSVLRNNRIRMPVSSLEIDLKGFK